MFGGVKVLPHSPTSTAGMWDGSVRGECPPFYAGDDRARTHPPSLWTRHLNPLKAVKREGKHPVFLSKAVGGQEKKQAHEIPWPGKPASPDEANFEHVHLQGQVYRIFWAEAAPSRLLGSRDPSWRRV